jgi:acetyl-CoA C-acetyltransferase
LSDPNTPVVIGISQLISRDADPKTAPSPLDLLERITRQCADDAGPASAVISALDTIGIVDVAGWNPQNPARLLADRLGIEPKTELASRVGGELSLVLVNTIAERILEGSSRIGLIVGTNNLYVATKAFKAQLPLDWPQGGEGEPELLGSEVMGNSERERAYGINAPTNVYPMIENALRARRGRTLDEHQRCLGALMSPFTKVAAANPYAWFPVERSAEELITPTEENRMICFPYPKFLNAVLNTDQAAGAIICSQAAAEELGVPREKWVYWWGGANTVEKSWFVSERAEIGESPAITECARRTFANANVSIDEIDYLDFYSCFPAAVELGCEAYGVAEDDPRGLTVTGGLPYAGGPGNNYPMHSLVTTIERLRSHPAGTDAKGLVTGNGWYVTKHSASVFGTQPNPSRPKGRSDEPIEIGAEPLGIADVANGAAVIDSYTLVYGRDGRPESGIVLGRLESDGRRFIATTRSDPAQLAELESREPIGRSGSVEHVDGRNVFALD